VSTAKFLRDKFYRLSDQSTSPTLYHNLLYTAVGMEQNKPPTPNSCLSPGRYLLIYGRPYLSLVPIFLYLSIFLSDLFPHIRKFTGNASVKIKARSELLNKILGAFWDSASEEINESLIVLRKALKKRSQKKSKISQHKIPK
jgi:hypothetical protein